MFFNFPNSWIVYESLERIKPKDSKFGRYFKLLLSGFIWAYVHPSMINTLRWEKFLKAFSFTLKKLISKDIRKYSKLLISQRIFSIYVCEISTSINTYNSIFLMISILLNVFWLCLPALCSWIRFQKLKYLLNYLNHSLNK